MKDQIEIITRVLELLSAYDTSQLERAASSPLVSGDIRNAISSLARARATNTKSPTGNRSDSVGRESRTTTRRDGSVSKRIEADIRAALLDSGVVGSSAELAALLSSAKVGIEFRPKDGRERLVERFFRALKTFPADEQRDKLQLLLKSLRPNDTEGWFRVIRGAAE